MIRAIHDLLGMSGGDGDFIKLELPATTDPDDLNGLLDAWSEERGRSVEYLLLLGRVRGLLARLLAAGRLTDQNEREVRCLLRLIDALDGDRPADHI